MLALNLSLLPNLRGPGGQGEPGGVPLRNEQLTGHSASTHPRSRATSWQQTLLPQGLHVTCWEEPKYLPSLPWGRGEGTMLLTQSPPWTNGLGQGPRAVGPGLLPEPTGCAQCQSEQGRAAEPSSGTVSAHSGAHSTPVPPGPLPAHLPPARGAGPREAAAPAPTVHPPAGAKQMCPRPLHAGLGSHRLPHRQSRGQGHGLHKTLDGAQPAPATASRIYTRGRGASVCRLSHCRGAAPKPAPG